MRPSTTTPRPEEQEDPTPPVSYRPSENVCSVCGCKHFGFFQDCARDSGREEGYYSWR